MFPSSDNSVLVSAVRRWLDLRVEFRRIKKEYKDVSKQLDAAEVECKDLLFGRDHAVTVKVPGHGTFVALFLGEDGQFIIRPTQIIDGYVSEKRLELTSEELEAMNRL